MNTETDAVFTGKRNEVNEILISIKMIPLELNTFQWFFYWFKQFWNFSFDRLCHIDFNVPTSSNLSLEMNFHLRKQEKNHMELNQEDKYNALLGWPWISQCSQLGLWNILIVSLQRGKTFPMFVLIMASNNLMLRFQWCWSFGECWVLLHCYCSQIYSGPEW